MYVELWSHKSGPGWRWGPWVSLIYNAIIGLGLLFTYFPHSRMFPLIIITVLEFADHIPLQDTPAQGFSRRAILKKIDYVGGVLSITGLTLL